MGEKYLRRRLRAILDPCLKAMKKDTKSSGVGKKLQVREDNYKSRNVRHANRTRTLIEHTTYSIGLPGPEPNANTGFIRDYLVIDLADHRIESADLPYLGLLGYMGKRS